MILKTSIRLSVYSLFVLLLACKKEDDRSQEPDTGPVDTLAYGIPFGNVPATADIVMYEVNERAFSAEGDLQGVILRLDSIKAVGANVIWLMPIHPIGTIQSVNSPYSVQDYKKVNPEFGTLGDLRTLVDSAHRKGMAVILDWVANHTAWDHPWITDHPSWYSQDASGNIIIPPGTNWQDVADLNFENEEMRLAMIDAMKYWILTANIDGFRCDAADMVPFDFWQQAIDSLGSLGRDLVLLAEGSRADHFTAGFQMNFAWDFYSGIKNVWNGNSAGTLFNIHHNEYVSVPEGARKLRFTTNHDESAWDATPMVLFDGEDGALAASVVASCLGGVPLIYGSQEVGRVSPVPFFSNSPIDWSENPDMLAAYRKIYAFYNTSEALRSGSMTSYSHTDVVCFKKTFQAEEVLVLVNCRSHTVPFSLPAELTDSFWKDAFTGSEVHLTDAVDLGAFDYLVLQK